MEQRIIAGWREWISLPELGIKKIKAKADTGARTSALHAFKVDTYLEHGQQKVRFDIHPLQYSKEKVSSCVANVIDIRSVMDSGGHREERCVITTPIVMGERSWLIEITLTSRDDMRFRMLLGRTALSGILIDTTKSYLFSKPKLKL